MKQQEKLARFYDLVDHIETAMFTTRRPDGLLVSRPMATQRRSPGADLWFVTSKGSHKLDEIRNDPHVNLAYFSTRTKEWISVAGVARIVKNRDKIRELYSPDWRAWFGGAGPDDPQLVLIAIKIRFAVYLELNKPVPVILFEVVKGMVTGEQPHFEPPKTIEGDEVRKGRSALKKPKARGAR
jgi:general stress protein 26